MSTLIDKAKVHWEARDGFAMPLVLLALVVMSTIAVAALTTASDEQKSARAVREAGLAFYDAEAGLWESWANWPEESVVTAIAQGDSLDLGWQTLDNGADYRGKIQWDAGWETSAHPRSGKTFPRNSLKDHGEMSKSDIST